MAGKMVVNYGKFNDWADQISRENQNLLDRLHEIKDLINSLAGDAWESDAAAAIRQKITGMEGRFEDYYKAVDNYVIYIRNTAQTYQATEKTNTSNAEQFI